MAQGNSILHQKGGVGKTTLLSVTACLMVKNGEVRTPYEVKGNNLDQPPPCGATHGVVQSVLTDLHSDASSMSTGANHGQSHRRSQ